MVDDGQFVLDSSEAGPVLGDCGPAEPHHLVDLVRTVAGLAEYLASLHPLHHLGVLGPALGHVSAGEHLPAQHSVRPHVALAGEPGEVQHLQTINVTLALSCVNLLTSGGLHLMGNLAPPLLVY